MDVALELGPHRILVLNSVTLTANAGATNPAASSTKQMFLESACLLQVSFMAWWACPSPWHERNPIVKSITFLGLLMGRDPWPAWARGWAFHLP